ncbi:hypothetical protein [Usitatibacter palustris]|uniref:FecR family protein n=1 Tax=Usitatibacter palustris TaxID=2732487 RepID=A0A6M4H939_9PROT|nr:hypothetical protein [Usitatibacter palustris]QJR15792.1 hypothetical protein DSM104440_02618 [Usitatibacter palustris]
MKKIIVALMAAGAITPAFADDEPVIVLKDLTLKLADASAHAEAWGRWAEDFSAQMDSAMGSMFAHRVGSSKAVKGAPYSAEVVTETNQHLADGNVITKKSTSLVYRDGEGRTRQEAVRAGKESTVYITDPVAGSSIILSPDKKRATVSPRTYQFVSDKQVQRVRVGTTDVKIENGKVFLDGNEVPGGKIELKSKSGKNVKIENGKIWVDGKELVADGKVYIRNVESVVGADGTRREEVRVQVVRSSDGREMIAPVAPIAPVPPVSPMAGVAPPVPPVPPIPPLPGMGWDTARLGKGVTTSLGAKDFEGVKAEGKSTLWTIPAGEIGNRNPISVVSETWYSPDLKVTVYSRYSDPRQGESIYRLVNLKRAEPAATLFKPPEGYEIRGKGRDRPPQS